jgi:hypothetical protein
MALVSPGVQVSVVDESFYTPAEPGTTPVIFVTSSENKLNASGTGTAIGTLSANAGKPYLLTSQRDLAETFGDPTFQVDASNNAIHGSELNEYGLQAAYSYLGVSNRAWVVRADINLSQLVARTAVPTADPSAGQYWLDTGSSVYGIQLWNNSLDGLVGQAFSNKVPLVLTGVAQVVDYDNGNYTPLSSLGTVGDYAVVAVSNLNTIWYRSATGWVELGSQDWKGSIPTVVGSKIGVEFGEDSAGAEGPFTFVLNGTVIPVSVGDRISDVVTTIVNLNITGVSAAEVNGELAIYNDGTATSTVSIADGSGNTAVLTFLGIASGDYLIPAVQISKHTQIPDTFKTTAGGYNGRPTGSVWIKTTTPNLGARWRVKTWNENTRLWDSVEAPIYATAEAALLELDRTGGGSGLVIGDVFVQSNVAGDVSPLGTFKLFRRAAVGATVITTNPVTLSNFTNNDAYEFTIEATSPGSSSFSSAASGLISFVGSATARATAIDIATTITNANIPYISADVDDQDRVVLQHSKGGEIRITDSVGSSSSVIVGLGIAVYNLVAKTGTRFVSFEPGTDGDTNPLQYRISNWEVLNYLSSNAAPTNTAAAGTLWYNSIVDEVDIMINNGSTWVGYKDSTSPVYSLTNGTDPNGPIVSASRPTTQTDNSDLVLGDLWIDTSDIENYPVIYRYTGPLTDTWTLIDNTDQTTENGIVFGDARYGATGATGNTATTIKSLLTSNYLDPDAPDPALYPKNTLLFNTRRSGFNVKRYEVAYINGAEVNVRFGDQVMSGYAKDRWVTESGNQEDGAGTFGRKSQRKVVVQSLQAVVNSNDEIRNEDSRRFNLIACPGYPELIGELVTLNNDRGLTAFVIGDSPARLTPDATSLNEWATNARTAVEDNDNGLVTNDEYLGVFYPWGFTSDNFGNNVVVPPSHMMLRTMALSDQVSYPWFAPAGTRRGGISNASSTGYINAEGEFVSVALNEGQRDTLYSSNVNPITFITGSGLVNFGQKTRARGASSLDRINVARLVVYLRSQLSVLAKPYIFEPNDKITRDEIKQQVESLLLELVGQRALYDFLVVCDESNNTPSRIDRNELYVDIAIEPVKSIEFIYIPLRLKNTGEIAGIAG